MIDGAEKIAVTLSNGKVCRADVIAEDPENDIALLKLKDPPAVLPVIPLVRPWRLLLGETVIAVGNPYGLDGTVTVGILSGINRSLADGNRLLFSDLLQTDAAIFPGNSGGPLINLDGCMIGMNMAVKRNAPGISFAVPLLRIENVLAKYMLPARLEQNTCMGLALFLNDRDGEAKVANMLTTTAPGTTPYNKPHLYPQIILSDK